MSGFFITASGTAIGKTLVTSALCYQRRIHYKPVMALKPVISGLSDGLEQSDSAIIAQALGRRLSGPFLDVISPFRYQAPLSPAMAAKLEGKSLDYAALLAHCRLVLSEFPCTLIEGVGGAFVPLGGGKLVADWIKDLDLECLLVGGTYLGSQSHILASLEALKARQIKVRAIILSTSPPVDAAGQNNPDPEASYQSLKEHCTSDIRLLPRLTQTEPWKHAPDLYDILE